MKIIYSNLFLASFWLGLMVIFTFTSCETESGDPGIEKPGTLFSPYITTTTGTLVSSAFSDSMGLTVSIGWSMSPDSNYQVEYSRNNFETIEKVIRTDSNAVRISGLWGSTRQYLRVKTVSDNPAYKDSKYSALVFTTNAEQVFTPSTFLPNADSVILKWDSTRLVSNLRASSLGMADSAILLTDVERFYGRKIVKNMQNKTYTFRLLGYNSDVQVRGTTTVKFDFKVVSFNTQVPDVSVPSIKVSTGKKAVKPANPQPGASQPVGTVFVNWYREPECINVFNFVTNNITDDLTLYAKWQ